MTGRYNLIPGEDEVNHRGNGVGRGGATEDTSITKTISLLNFLEIIPHELLNKVRRRVPQEFQHTEIF